MPEAERNAALAAAALLLLLILQFALPRTADLPEVAPARRIPRPQAEALAVRPVSPYPAILSADLFSPGRSGAGGGGGEGASAGGGLQVLGVSISSRGAVAYLRGPSGLVAARPGTVVGGWRVAGVSRDAVILTRGRERRAVPPGASASTVAPPASAETSGDSQ